MKMISHLQKKLYEYLQQMLRPHLDENCVHPKYRRKYPPLVFRIYQELLLLFRVALSSLPFYIPHTITTESSCSINVCPQSSLLIELIASKSSAVIPPGISPAFNLSNVVLITAATLSFCFSSL